MTNFENIIKTNEDMSNFISKVAYARFDPWAKSFKNEFCHDCPTTHVTYERSGREDDLHECDFSYSKCPHGDDITWWLNQKCTE